MGIPGELLELVSKMDINLGIKYTLQLSHLLTACKAKVNDFRKKISEREVVYIGQCDVIGELLKYCEGNSLTFDGIDMYHVAYNDFATLTRVDVDLPILNDESICAWEKVLNHSQSIHRYHIYKRLEYQGVAHQESVNKILRKLDTDQKLIDRPKIVKGPHYESDPIRYLGNATRIEVLSIESPFVKEMTNPRNHRNVDAADLLHYINEIMPVFRIGCDSMNYGYGYVFQQGLNRSQIRLLRWKSLLMSIDRDQYKDIVIYGASREALEIYDDLGLCVFNPQAREEYEKRGMNILTSMSMRKYCLLDPFNTIWSEVEYVEDEEKKNDLFSSNFGDLSCIGRMVRGKIASGTDVRVPGFGMNYIPMVLHKFEYYMLPPELKCSSYHYGSNKNGILIQVLDYYCLSKGSTFDECYVSPFWLVYISNLVRNKAYLEWYSIDNPKSLLSILDLMYTKVVKFYKSLKENNRNTQADDVYVGKWLLYYKFMFRIMLDGMDPKYHAIFSDDITRLNISNCSRSIKESNYSCFYLQHLYSAKRLSRRRPNYDKRQEVSLIPSPVEVDDIKGNIDTRIYLNHSNLSVSAYSMLNKYPLKSRKDDIFLDVNSKTTQVYDKLEKARVTFRDKGAFADNVVIRHRKKINRRAYNGSVITSKPLLRLIRQKDRSDFSTLDFSHHRSSSMYGHRSKSLNAPVVSYLQKDHATFLNKNFYGNSHNSVSRGRLF